jgi:hypothetical protein
LIIPITAIHFKNYEGLDIQTHLMKYPILLFITFFISFGQSHAQEKSFINHTELGVSFGQVKMWEGNYDTRVNFTFQSFNGAWVNPHHAIGFLIGVDTYPNLTLMPFAFGWRGFYNKGKRTSPFAGFDLGYSSAWMEKRISNDFSDQWYEGGLLLSPMVGIKRKSKKGSHAFTWSAGFKRQYASFYDGVRDPFSSSSPDTNNLPPGYSSIREESYILNSLIVKWGVIF